MREGRREGREGGRGTGREGGVKGGREGACKAMHFLLNKLGGGGEKRGQGGRVHAWGN